MQEGMIELEVKNIKKKKTFEIIFLKKNRSLIYMQKYFQRIDGS